MAALTVFALAVALAPDHAAGAPLVARPRALPLLRAVVALRGGGDGGDASGGYGGGSSATECAQHAERAAALFGNMRVPASLMLGSLGPLTFSYALPAAATEAASAAWKMANLLIGTLSLLSELVAIVFASVALNKLTETTPAPAPSVLALLRRDYELAWLGTNVHFFLGLLGAAAMVGIRAGLALGAVPAAAVVSGVLLMMAMLNDGIRVGEGKRDGVRFGGHLGSLCWRYACLLLRDASSSFRPLLACALLLPLGATGLWALA